MKHMIKFKPTLIDEYGNETPVTECDETHPGPYRFRVFKTEDGRTIAFTSDEPEEPSVLAILNSETNISIEM